MGRGSSGGGGELGNGGGRNAVIIDTTDMISARNADNQKEVDDVLTVGKNMVDKYGDIGILNGTYQIATMGEPDASQTLAYYDPSTGALAMNSNFMNSKKIDSVYDKTVKSGYHPSRGNKSGAEAVASHEYGHALADAYGRSSGKNIDTASKDIVTQAMKTLGQKKGSKEFASKISGYAAESYAECVAEAVADVYCNGNKAHKNSTAIVNVLNSKLGKKKK